MTARRRRRIPAWAREQRCICGHLVRRYQAFCSSCGRAQRWGDVGGLTGAECYKCGWAVSDKFACCPWCGANIHEQGYSSDEPLKAPRGFRMDARCDWGCGGGVQYPMNYCPWCSRRQFWNEESFYEGECPHCGRGVDDLMNSCPWCGGDPTGRDLIPRALTRVRRLLLVSRIRDWGYRILLRPGVSGVDPKYPAMVEIEQRYVVGKRRRDEIPWTMLVGLITHELGHSFLYHHWDWARGRQFQRAFGEVGKAYRGMDNTWVYFQRRRIAIAPTNFVSAYAAKHPQEDFAETFRFYVTRRGRLRDLFAEFGRKRKGVILYEKFLVLHDYVRALRGWGGGSA